MLKVKINLGMDVNNRFVITTVITLVALMFTQKALAADSGSTHSPYMKNQRCYVVEGDLVEWNGWPPNTRLVSKGHKHVYVFNDDCPQSPAFQKMQVTKNGSLNGKFEVCPTGKSFYVPDEFKPLERACLGSGRNLSSLLPILVYYQEGHGPKAKPLIPAAKKVADAYDMMKKHPGDSLYEVQYLLAFPHDYQTYVKVYDDTRGSQLHDKMLDQVYLAMKALGKKHPELVGIDLMTLGKQAEYSFPDFLDNTEMLEQTIMGYAVANTRLFIQLFNQLSEAEKQKLGFLISSIEYIDFQDKASQFETLIKNLKSSGAKDIADQLQQQFKQAKINWAKKMH